MLFPRMSLARLMSVAGNKGAAMPLATAGVHGKAMLTRRSLDVSHLLNFADQSSPEFILNVGNRPFADHDNDQDGLSPKKKKTPSWVEGSMPYLDM